MTPQLLRLMFPMSWKRKAEWQVERAFEALLSYQAPLRTFIDTYHATQKEVLR